MQIGDIVDVAGLGCGGPGVVVGEWKGRVAAVARLERGGYYWRLNTEPKDAGCGATSFTLLAEGWAQEWCAAVSALRGAAAHLEIVLEGAVRADRRGD